MVTKGEKGEGQIWNWGLIDLFLWKLLGHVWLFVDPMDCSLPGSSVHGILQARIPEWLVIPFSRGSSWPRSGIQVSYIAGRFFTIWAYNAGDQVWSPGRLQSMGLWHDWATNTFHVISPKKSCLIEKNQNASNYQKLSSPVPSIA